MTIATKITTMIITIITTIQLYPSTLREMTVKLAHQEILVKREKLVLRETTLRNLKERRGSPATTEPREDLGTPVNLFLMKLM